MNRPITQHLGIENESSNLCVCEKEIIKATGYTYLGIKINPSDRTELEVTWYIENVIKYEHSLGNEALS